MNYIVIDFETANSKRDSACALGLIEVNNGQVVKELDYLINPEDNFDYFNTTLHGIDPSMVKNKPTFPEIWSEIKNLIENKMIIAHNASFDISVLRRTLEKYNLDFPNFNYSCTRILSKKTWPNLNNYKLDTIASKLGIKFAHHQACEDAMASAKIFEEILKLNKVTDLETLHKELQVKIGCIYPGGYNPAEVKSSRYSIKEYIKPKDITPESNEFDENHEFYNKGIAFTGTLTAMARKDAAQLAVNKGAFYCSSVNKKTNYLVIGVQDYSKFVDGQKSSKLNKAEELINLGQDLEIIDESEFLNLI